MIVSQASIDASLVPKTIQIVVLFLLMPKMSLKNMKEQATLSFFVLSILSVLFFCTFIHFNNKVHQVAVNSQTTRACPKVFIRSFALGTPIFSSKVGRTGSRTISFMALLLPLSCHQAPILTSFQKNLERFPDIHGTILSCLIVADYQVC